MRTTLKRFAKLAAGYSLVTLIGPLFTILLTPIYTRVMSPADYGIVEVAITLSSFMTTFAIMSIDQALNSFFFDGEHAYRSDLVSTALVFVALISAGFAVVLFIAAVPLAQLLFHDTSRVLIIYLVSLNILTVPIYNITTTALRLHMGVKRVNILGLTFLFSTVIGNLVLVVVLQYKATGVIAANVLANGLGAALGIVLTMQVLRGTFKSDLLKQLLKAGSGLLFGSVSFLLLAGSDRLLLTQYVTQNDQGLYAIANKLASMIYVILSAAWSAWWPLALELANKPDSKRQYSRMFEFIVAGSTSLSLFIGLFSPEILRLFTRDVYVPAAPYALALMIYTGPISFINSSFTIGFYVKKRTIIVSIVAIVTAALNILLNIILDPVWGVWGAVWATVLAGGAGLILSFIFSQRVMPVPYRLGRTGFIAGVYGIMAFLFLAIPTLNTIPFKVIALAGLGAAIFMSGIITQQQIQVGLKMIRERVLGMAAAKRAGKFP
jgi:O-antigen/teichoic acid export membrane protein